jgi:K+ transporter
MYEAVTGRAKEEGMAYRRNPYMFIPIVLTIAVVLIAPKTVQEHGINGVFLVLAAIAFPWFLFYVISRAVQHVIDEAKKKSRANENHDFV